MPAVRPRVLTNFERSHTPGRAVVAALLAREAGFERVSLDLIYGTPGESDGDWAASLRAALREGVARLTLDGRLMADRIAREPLAA